MRRLIAGLLALPLAATCFAGATPASAASPTSGPCVGTTGPVCHYWYGTVERDGSGHAFVSDGDTLDVDVDGDGTATPVRIRMTGINTQELSTYSHTAANRLEQLVNLTGGRVRLSAQDPTSHSGDRMRRVVSVETGGVWRDLNRTLLDEGHALFMSNGTETAFNQSYGLAAQTTAATGRQIWDTDFCRSGPAQTTPIRIWVNSDADGDDGRNVNGEWIRIHNGGTTALSLGGWQVRDSGPIRYTLPATAAVRAGATITVHVGRGTNTATNYYWGLAAPVFENVTGAPTWFGDGGYLFDRDGDLRARFHYPCLVACADPLAGKVAVTKVVSDAPGSDATNPNGEEVQLRNVGTRTVQLEGYQLWNAPYGYAFGPNSRLAPGETVRVRVGRGTETRLSKFWGKSAGILDNGGERVVLQTFGMVRISCKAWGTVRC